MTQCFILLCAAIVYLSFLSLVLLSETHTLGHSNKSNSVHTHTRKLYLHYPLQASGMYSTPVRHDILCNVLVYITSFSPVLLLAAATSAGAFLESPGEVNV